MPNNKEPRFIKLKEAISHIKQACEAVELGKNPSPFFFIVGAGLSKPPIPSSSEIITHCQEFAKTYGRTDPCASTSPMDIYSHWFGKAYNSPVLRKNYLKGIIENKPISHANLRLAHILSTKKVANIVVTPNFDDQISKALTLFGIPFVLCDHPATTMRIDIEDDDIKIIHVHGTYKFYDLSNLSGEINDAAAASDSSPATMREFLDSILRGRSPLIMGYSGWEGDVIMTALKRRLTDPTPLGHTLYWFCYRRSDIMKLPPWLTENANVCFVVPDEEARGKGKDQTNPVTALQESSKSAVQVAGLDNTKDNVLKAQEVLEAIIESFELDTPSLIKDPLDFYAKHLDKSFLQDGEVEDLYSLKEGVIDKIKKANSLWIEDNKAKPANKEDVSLEKIRDAVRKSSYATAIKEAKEIDLSKLDQSQLAELMDLMHLFTRWSLANPQEELDRNNIIIGIFDKFIPENQTLKEKEQVARALVNKGVTLGVLNRSEEAIKAYNDVIERFGDAKEPGLKEQV
ncbi:hypothetical protein EPN18_04470, partial [bacterium]